MSKERRQLEDWEKAECAALKAAIEDFNKALPRDKRLTQDDISHELGMSQGTLSSHLNGHRAINLEMAAAMSVMLSVPIDRFSERLADELASLSGAITRVSGELDDARKGSPSTEVASRARNLALAASPRSRSALEKIVEAADSGLLSEDDILLLEVIASRLASQGTTNTESPHQRLRTKLKNDDSIPQQ
ncbi:helix-turn-helix domain-containing protein [Pseudomonas viridiflava]|uniref:helix-turn-helix domain-containing protein n=1 Tax=Pseudomonas viridiflava TaxID=33069 RepID=UPI001F132AFB|nr:helix-turn-helix transcriptional regulator [Pseudomonas viridiflava]